MNKQEFLDSLQNGMAGLPLDEINERINFYAEMIDDRIEDGMTEEAAVEAVGDVKEIVAQILQEIPLAKLVKERVKTSHRLKAWDIVLIVLGAPLWLPLLVAAGAIVLSIYISIWAVIISLWAAVGSVAGAGFGGILAGIFFLVQGLVAQGWAMIGAGIGCLGLFILFLMGCKELTKGLVWMTKKIALALKHRCIRKEKKYAQ